MPPSPTNAELQEELDRMRNIIGQYRQKEIETADLLLKNDTLVNTLQLRIAEEMARRNVLRSPLSTPFSPIPAQNLQPAMTSVAQLDGTIVQTMIDTSLASIETRITSFETRITNLLSQHQQQHTPGPIPASTPLGAAFSSGRLTRTAISIDSYFKCFRRSPRHCQRYPERL